ncbi:MAG: response regulator [Patescibacteria group bacterium]
MPKRVLVVEVDPFVRSLVDEVLSAADHDVELLSSASEAWSRLEKGEQFDLIIISGGEIELLRRVREDARTTDVPVILMSGADPVPFKVVCTDLGATFLSKPFSIDQLLALVGSRVEMGVAPDALAF